MKRQKKHGTNGKRVFDVFDRARYQSVKDIILSTKNKNLIFLRASAPVACSVVITHFLSETSIYSVLIKTKTAWKAQKKHGMLQKKHGMSQKKHGMPEKWDLY